MVGYTTSSKGWHQITKVPNTVLGALLDEGVYKDLGYDENLKKVRVEPYLPAWWYRTEFELPHALPRSVADASETSAKRIRLVFKGINYRANIWLNGQRLAQNDTIMGTFRYFDLDISDLVQEANALAVEVTRPYNGLVGDYSPFNGDVDPVCPGGHEGECLDL